MNVVHSSFGEPLEDFPGEPRGSSPTSYFRAALVYKYYISSHCQFVDDTGPNRPQIFPLQFISATVSGINISFQMNLRRVLYVAMVIRVLVLLWLYTPATVSGLVVSV